MKTPTSRALALTASAFVISSFPLTAAPENAETKEKKVEQPAKEEKAAPAQKNKAKAEKATNSNSAASKTEKAQKKLAVENALAAEKVKKEQAKLRAEVSRLKLEKERLSERLALAELERKQKMAKDEAAHKKALIALTREASLAKIQAEMLGSELKAKQAEFGLKLVEIENEVKAIEAAKKRENYANSEPVYLADPLLKDGTLVISDRRIDLNGPIHSGTAKHVTERINYFNNKNAKHPIFIIIDDSPGGSVMSGMSILESMHGSDAPVYVVVKTFAASMAAGITTLAERSFAFPNAMILHHQVISSNFGNLTETREHTKQLEEWWRRLAEPIAQKMGISRDQFIEKMYENTVSGDWTEFADEAQKLKWVDHVVNNLKETSLLKNPDAKKTPTPTTRPRAEGDSMTPENIIPRLNPKDMLYMYNPDNYYKLQR